MRGIGSRRPTSSASAAGPERSSSTLAARRNDELRVEGAIHLGFPDTAVDSLAPPLPDKDVRILIYCNNNSRGDPSALPSKLPSASLNLPTYIALYDDGYRTVWELGPLIDIETAAIAFARSTSPRP
ncbi:MAG TPA: hypothetical protein VH041_17465 [Caldimonas sp.]|nr:hypothetical protein [Caldimonas sp.]HEX4236078.1 hypothetical protein [Caldimonas sp.]